MASGLPETSVAEMLAEKIVALQAGALPAATARKCEDLLIDVVGLCVTARNEDYVGSALAGCDDDGPCTAIGHRRTLNAAGAAFVNGTAAHGEDFDDTFEGGPVHAGAVIVPAVLAACERHNPDGRMALIGIAVGTEVLCRLSLVVPKAVHKAGFHPTAIFGAMGAAAGVGAALGLNARQIVDALGIAGSMAGGIIEYLAEGAWTKRLHAGWAAQSGIRAALLARAGFVGPRTVFEGVHGLFHGFAHTTEGDYDALTGDFGGRPTGAEPTVHVGTQGRVAREFEAGLPVAPALAHRLCAGGLIAAADEGDARTAPAEPAPNIVAAEPKSAIAPAAPAPNIAGRWRDDRGTTYDVKPKGRHAFRYSASGPSCRPDYKFTSSGRGTIGGIGVNSSYSSDHEGPYTLKFRSNGNCRGTLFDNGTKMNSTCDDTICGKNSFSLSKQ
jgi:hypothetical protein